MIRSAPGDWIPRKNDVAGGFPLCGPLLWASESRGNQSWEGFAEVGGRGGQGYARAIG